jgi:hypothetical protein
VPYQRLFLDFLDKRNGPQLTHICGWTVVRINADGI